MRPACPNRTGETPVLRKKNVTPPRTTEQNYHYWVRPPATIALLSRLHNSIRPNLLRQGNCFPGDYRALFPRLTASSRPHPSPRPPWAVAVAVADGAVRPRGGIRDA